MKLLLAAALAALTLTPATNAHTTTAWWTSYEAEQRLTVGRFASANGVASATCIGTGAATGKAGTFTRKFRHFDCKVHNRAFTVERHLVLHVRSETGFTAQWLTAKACG